MGGAGGDVAAGVSVTGHSRATSAAEGLAIVTIDGAMVAVVAANHALGVDGASAAGSSADIGVGGPGSGFCGVWHGNQGDDGGNYGN